jgi:hypothetical protein
LAGSGKNLSPSKPETLNPKNRASEAQSTRADIHRQSSGQSGRIEAKKPLSKKNRRSFGNILA